MTPSWYDVLDVEPTATTDEIRSGWKTSVADLDPTDRRFRLLTQAAEVLLDPVRRADHDAALAADEKTQEPVAPTAPRPVVTATGREDPRVHAVPLEKADRADRAGEAAVTSSAVQPVPGRSWWAPPAWLIVAVAVIAAAVATAAFLTFRSPSDSAVAADTEAAQSAAERASEAVLAYDYRDLASSEAAASAYLTPSFRKDYDQLFTLIKENAATVKPVVTVQVLASGIQRVSKDGDRVAVVVFVNRPTTNAEITTPRVSQDQVTMQMVKVDGDWLVDDMATTPAAGQGAGSP